jgi:hypothetical protein
MLPLSTQATRGCNPISSECVIWQGPDLNCINVCNGDNVSTVIAKVAELVCSLIENGLEASVPVENIAVGCTYDAEDPASTIQQITQDIILTLCNVQTQQGLNTEVLQTLIADIDDLELQQGPQGAVGPQGLTGPQGIAGAAGENGTPGEQGPIGEQGLQGDTGLQGDQGLQGDPGIDGVDGSIGETGADGCTIVNAEVNDNGTITFFTDCGGIFTTTGTNIIGPQGDPGAQGDIGLQGDQGAQGDQGTAGIDGQDGAPGADGITIISTVDNGDGTFTWNYSDGTFFEGTTIAGIDGTDGIDGIDGADGTELFVKMPDCFFNDDDPTIGTLTNNYEGAPFIMGPGAVMYLQTNQQNAYVEVITYTSYDTDNSPNNDAVSGNTTNQYNGWIEFVNAKLCCILSHTKCSPTGPTDDNLPDSDSSTGTVTDAAVKTLPVITTLQKRLLRVERKGGAAYIPPTVIPKYIGKVGQKMQLQDLLKTLEQDYGKLKQALGTASEILKASKAECINLASLDRLSGNGVMSTIPGWSNSPSNLAQSFTNSWKTICDMRTAIETLKSTVTPSGCTGFTYDPKVSLIKSQTTGSVQSIKFLFTHMVIPDGFYDCDKVKGTRITIQDSSLNTYVDYVNVSNLITSTTGKTISGLNTKGLDINSNFKIKMDFCFTDGSHQCERIMEFTLENTSACPTVTLTTTGETAVEYSVTGLSSVSKSTYEIIVEDQSGSMISKQTIKEPSYVNTTGKAAGLIAGTKYDIYVQTTSLAGNISTCDRTTFSTTAAQCTSYSKTSTDYKTLIADLGSTTQTIATYKNGATTTAWIVGFNASTGLPEVYKGTDSSETGTEGVFTLNTTSISDNPTTSINCGNVAYPASGMTTLMNSNENGWQYLGSLKYGGNTTYYIYALANTANKSIDQVVFCCDCKPSYVRTKYGDTSTISTSEAYAPDKHAWYVVNSKVLRIPIDIVGYSTQTTAIKWNATSTLGGTTAFVLPTDAGYDSSLGGTVQLKYTPNTTRPIAGIDSVDVYAETDCTVGNPGNRTINTITIPIVDAGTIENTDTDITVFIDTNVVTVDEATVIKTEMDRVKTTIQSNCSTWTGTVNYVPVSGNSSGDYLEYTKAMVDKANGGSGSISVASGYSAVKSLPAYWSSGGSVPSSVYLICFIGDVNAKGNYGGASLSAGWGTQPTSKYQQNYDELLDILYVNGAARTTWGTSQGCTYKKFELKQILVPIVSGSQDSTAATVLQTAGALTGTVLSETGYKGFLTGSVKNPINLSGYIGPNASMMVPYTGTTVGGSNTLNGLYNYGFRVVPFIDRTYLETDSNLQSGGNQSEFLGNAMLRVTGSDSSGMGLSIDTKCPTGTDSVIPMSGILNGAAVTLYGNDGSDPTSCSKAGSAAAVASNCVTLYNTTGTQFDPSVPAYLSAAGGNAEAVSNQPVDGAWYAQNGPTAQNAVRRIAQYDRDGATTGIYWVNIKYVADC